MSRLVTSPRTPHPEVTWTTTVDAHTVHLVGDLDAPVVDEVERVVHSLVDLKPCCSRVELDVADVGVFGSKALNLVERLTTWCRARTVEFEVVNTTGPIERVLGFARHDRPDAQAGGLIASEQFEQIISHGVLNGRDAVIMTTAQLDAPGPQIVFVNRAFSDLYGYAADEIIGLTPRELQGPLTNRSKLDRMRDTIGRGESFVADIVNYTADRLPFVMSWKVMPVTARHCDATYYMSMQSDVTADRRRQRFEVANDVVDTQFHAHSIDLADPVVSLKQAMVTLLTAQTVLLGGGVATIVLTDRNDRDHRYSTASSDADTQLVNQILADTSRTPADNPVVSYDEPAHLMIDVSSGLDMDFVNARLVMSGIHPDRLRLTEPADHHRLLRRVFTHRT